MGASKKNRIKAAMGDVVQGVIAVTMPNATAIVPMLDGQTVETPIVQDSAVQSTQPATGVSKFLASTYVQDEQGNPVRIHCKQNFVAAVYFEVCKRMNVATRPLNAQAMSATKQIIAYVPEMPHKHGLGSTSEHTTALLKNEVSASGMNGYLRVLSHPAKAERIFAGSALTKPVTGVQAHAAQAQAYCDKYALHITGVSKVSDKPSE